MNNAKELIRTGLWIILMALTALTASVEAQYYIYKGKDGIQLFTDRQLPNLQGYKLLATVGRPTASASCVGVTANIMKSRASTHIPVISQYAKLYKVDPMLVKAIIAVESCFDKYAVSRVGAKGLMQLMPETAKSMGVYNVFNAKDNMRGGIKYFRQMMDRFQQDAKLALAAYNAGPLAVEKYKGIPPYPETEGYVKKVLRYYGEYGGKTDDAEQEAGKTDTVSQAEQPS